MSHVLIYILAVAGAVGLYLALPKRHGRHVAMGVLLGAVGLAMAYALFRLPGIDGWTRVLYYVFSGAAIASGAAMVTSVNPVYSALWFALVVLNACGLFLLLDAQFLAAATVIVYAGAIVVMFLFVIMLAQQRGGAHYDRSAREPLFGVLASFVILAAILATLTGDAPSGALADAPPAQPGGHVASLGARLFNMHLISLEIAGVLLLVALIGATAVVMLREDVEGKNDGEGE